MKASQDGFSIVEIIVSMVILSIVMLVMSNVIIVSSFQHSAALGKDDADFVARQKLTALQNPAIIPVPGVADVDHKGVTYHLVWTLSSTSPILATVTASWTHDGRGKSLKVAGYIEASNACAEITNNRAPSAVKYFDNSKVEIAGPVAINHGTPSDRFVCRIIGFDADTTQGDIVRISFDGGTSDNGKFKLSGDTLKTNIDFFDPALANKDYTVKVLAIDCRSNSSGTIAKSIVVRVGAANTKLKAPSPQNGFTIAENSTGSVGTLLHNESSMTGLTWIGTATPFTLNSSTGALTLSAPLDRESTPSFTFPVKLHRTSGAIADDSTISVTVNVGDVNEAPTNITISDSVITTAKTGVVATINVVDPDLDTTLWRTHNNLLSGAGSSFFTIVGYELRVKSGITLTTGNKAITISATDRAGAGFTYNKNFTIQITPPAASIPCTGIPDFVVYNGTNQVTYDGGWASSTSASKVKYDNKQWKGVGGQLFYNHAGLPGAVSYWQLVGGCQ